MTRLERLKKRADFLSVAKGRRWNSPSLALQSRLRCDEGSCEELRTVMVDGNNSNHLARLGFTVTKRVGNSVQRNRIRRRLKSALQSALPLIRDQALPRADHDYVLIARESALTAEFMVLVHEISSAFEGVHRERSSAKATRNSRGAGPASPRTI